MIYKQRKRDENVWQKVNVRDFLDEQYDLFINGEFQPSESGETLTVTNPKKW